MAKQENEVHLKLTKNIHCQVKALAIANATTQNKIALMLIEDGLERVLRRRQRKEKTLDDYRLEEALAKIALLEEEISACNEAKSELILTSYRNQNLVEFYRERYIKLSSESLKQEVSEVNEGEIFFEDISNEQILEFTEDFFVEDDLNE